MAKYINADKFYCDNIAALNNVIIKRVFDGASQEKIRIYELAVKSVLKNIKIAPAVDVRENVRGEWIKDELGTTVCSHCKNPRRDNRINHIAYCNSCGADMRGEAWSIK